MLEITNAKEFHAALDLLGTEVQESNFMRFYRQEIGFMLDPDEKQQAVRRNLPTLCEYWGTETACPVELYQDDSTLTFPVTKCDVVDEIDNFVFSHGQKSNPDLTARQIDALIDALQNTAIMASEARASFDVGEGHNEYNDPRAMTCNAAAQLLSKIAQSGDLNPDHRINALRSLLRISDINYLGIESGDIPTLVEDHSRLIIAGFYLRHLSNVYTSSPQLAMMLCDVASEEAGSRASQTLALVLALDISTEVFKRGSVIGDKEWDEHSGYIFDAIGGFCHNGEVDPDIYFATQISGLLTVESTVDAGRVIENLKTVARQSEGLQKKIYDQYAEHIKMLSESFVGQKFHGLTFYSNDMMAEQPSLRASVSKAAVRQPPMA